MKIHELISKAIDFGKVFLSTTAGSHFKTIFAVVASVALIIGFIYLLIVSISEYRKEYANGNGKDPIDHVFDMNVSCKKNIKHYDKMMDPVTDSLRKHTSLKHIKHFLKNAKNPDWVEKERRREPEIRRLDNSVVNNSNFRSPINTRKSGNGHTVRFKFGDYKVNLRGL